MASSAWPARSSSSGDSAASVAVATISNTSEMWCFSFMVSTATAKSGTRRTRRLHKGAQRTGLRLHDAHRGVRLEGLAVGGVEGDHGVVAQAAGDLDAGEAGDRGLHFRLFDFVVHHLIDEAASIFLVDGLTRDGEDVVVPRGDDEHADVRVGQQLAVFVVNLRGDFADGAGAAHDDGGGDSGDAAFPDAAGNRVPRDLNFLVGGEAADIGLVNECTN